MEVGKGSVMPTKGAGADWIAYKETLSNADMGDRLALAAQF